LAQWTSQSLTSELAAWQRLVMRGNDQIYAFEFGLAHDKKAGADYSFALLITNSRKGRAGFPATDAFGGIDFVTTAPAEIFVPEPTINGTSR
jgi:hypothetical protein